MDSPFFRSYWSTPTRPRYSKPAPAPRVVSIPVHFVSSERSRSDAVVKIQKAFRGFLVRKSVKRIRAIRREVEEIEKRISNKEMADLILRDSKEVLKVNEMLMNLLFRLDSVRGVDSGVRDFRKAVIKKAIALQETVDSIVAEAKNANTVAEVLDQNQEIEELVECLEDREMQDEAPKVTKSASNFTEKCNSFTNSVDRNETIEELDECLEDRGEVSDHNLEIQIESPKVADSASNFAEKCNSITNAVDQNQAIVELDECLEDRGEVSDQNIEIQIEAPKVTEKCNSFTNAVDQNQAIVELDECLEDRGEVSDQNIEIQIEAPKVTDSASIFAEKCNSSTNFVDQNLDLQNRVEPISNLIEPSVDSAHGKKDNVEIEMNANEDKEIVKSTESQSDSSANHQSSIEGGEDNSLRKQEEQLKIQELDQNRKNRELLEKMVEDNKKMMGLMAEIFERNAMQARVLSSLSQRVEHLERAFLCERLRRKKKKQSSC